MTSRDRADRLIAEASAILRELAGHVERQSWNLVVRRAQEVVELTLKALLAETGVDFPKVHDVASLFTETVRSRGLSVEEARLRRIEQISARLAAARAPAFYQEAEFREADAGRASHDAEEVFSFGQELLKLLRGGAAG